MAKMARKRFTSRKTKKTVVDRRQDMQIRRLVKANTGYFQTDLTVDDVANDSAPVSLLKIPQGDATSNRSGNLITVQSVNIYWEAIGSTTANTKTLLSVILVWDKQPQTSTFALSDYFNQSLTPSISTTNPTQKERFVTLHRRNYIISQTGNNIAHGHIYKRIKKSTRYAAGITEDPNSGGLYLLFNTNINAAGADQPQVQGFAMVKFTQ